MKISEKLEKLFAPLDVVIVEKDYEFLCEKTEKPDVPKEVLNDANIFLTPGEYADRNPTRWHIFQDESIEVGSDLWDNGLLNFYRLTCVPVVTELDNKNNHVTISVKFEILAINAKNIPNDAYKGVKCAFVKTGFGDHPLVTE